jgi:hypothetical protein
MDGRNGDNITIYMGISILVTMNRKHSTIIGNYSMLKM